MNRQQSTITEQIICGTGIGAALYMVSSLAMDELFGLMQIKLMPYGGQLMLIIPVAAMLGGFAGWSVGAQLHNRFSQAKTASLGGGLFIGSFVLWLWFGAERPAEPSNFIVLGPLVVGVMLLLLWGISLLFKRHESL